MTAHVDDIKSTAAEVLGGKRNARRHFDEIVSYFYDGPTAHPAVEEKHEIPRDLARQMCAQEDLYALSFNAIDEPYWRHTSEEKIERIMQPLWEENPEAKELVAAYNTLDSIAYEPENYVPYLAPDVDRLERAYCYLKARIQPLVIEEYDLEGLPESFE